MKKALYVVLAVIAIGTTYAVEKKPVPTPVVTCCEPPPQCPPHQICPPVR